jgi:type III pantothenate kinase
MCEMYFGVAPYFVEPGVNTRMPLAVDAPREVGADRYVDAFAAAAKYGPPLIVIDFGTATTFNCVNGRGEFIGGAIAPGLATSVEALVTRAARLARVELARPKEAIGRNTTTNLQSGAIYGYAGLVDGLVERMRGEMGGRAQVIATGGNAALVVDVARVIEKVDEHLRLDGLRLLYADAHPADGSVDTR